MRTTVSIVLILIAVAIFGLRIPKGIAFEQNVEGYLKRAADANTIELANQELSKVINYLEANNLTTGHTSVLWETPDEDIGFWYQNLKASQTELQELKSKSALEKTNVLIKLRETLVDVGERTKVTIPDGLEVYPNNLFWGILMWTAAISGLTGVGLLASELEKKSKEKKKLEEAVKD